MVIFWGCGRRSMGIFRARRAACLAITDPVQVRPTKIRVGVVEEHIYHRSRGRGAWSSTKTGGAWSSSGAAGGGAWASSERDVPPAWPSRTPYKSVPQKSGSESWKSTSTTRAGGGGAWSLLKLGEHGHLLGLWAEEHGHLLKLGRHGHFLGLREHGHLLGLRAEDHGHLPTEPCCLLGHHEPRTNPSHKGRSQSHGSLPKLMSSPLIACHLICLHERHQNLNRHPIVMWSLHRCQKCVK